MIGFLVSTTEMSVDIARKISDHTPIVTHQNIRFTELEERLDTIAQLGGEASGQLLVFQAFSLTIDKLGDRDETLKLLRGLGELDRKKAEKALVAPHIVEGPLTNLQARWLQWELKQAGTQTRLMLL